MTSKKTQKTSQKKLTSRKFLLIVLGVVLIGIVGWFFVAEPILDQRDKDRFLHAEARLEQVLEEKILPVAEPDHIEREQSCRYSGAKYAKGSLSCRVAINLAYPHLEEQEIYDLVDAITSDFDAILRTSVDRKTPRSGQALANEPALVQRIGIHHDYPSCSAQYSRLARFGFLSSVDYGDADGLYLIISCADSARAEHFPVE